MSNIVMTHPVHGAKVAISEQEARQDELRGWKRFVQPIVAPTVTPAEPEIPAFLSQVKQDENAPVETLEKAVESSLNTLIPRRGKRSK